MCGSRQGWAKSRLAFSVKATTVHSDASPRLAWCLSEDESRRVVGNLVRMVGDVVGRSPLLIHDPAGRDPCTIFAAPTRTGRVQSEKSHVHTSPQTSTKLSPGGASGFRCFVVTRTSHTEAPVSRLEPHVFHSNEGHPPERVDMAFGNASRTTGSRRTTIFQPS